MSDNLGNIDNTFNATLDPADQFKITLNELKDEGYDVGNALGPVLAECLQIVTPILKDIIGAWNYLSPGTQEMIIKCALLVAALGPVFSIISKVSGGISTVIDVGAKSHQSYRKQVEFFSIQCSIIGQSDFACSGSRSSSDSNICNIV